MGISWDSKTEDEEFVYYVHLPTGKSSWYHPQDEDFRQKFVKEKARLYGDGAITMDEQSWERHRATTIMDSHKEIEMQV